MDRHSKKDAKQEKINSKAQSMNLFTRQEVQREIRQLEEERSQEYNNDPLYRKAKKFWAKCDEKYFRSITVADISQKKQVTTSNQVLTLSSFQPTAFSNYRQEVIQTVLPSFKDNNKLKVLFKSLDAPFSSSIVSYQIQQAIPNYHNEQSHSIEDKGIRIKSSIRKNIHQEQNQSFSKNQTFSARNMRLDLDEYNDDLTLCTRIQKLSQIQSTYINEIDQQIAIWQWQMQKVNQQNIISWNNLIMDAKRHPELMKMKSIDQNQKQIAHIQNKLLWATVLRSFQAGFKDKTRKMLENYIQNQKNFNLKPPKGLATAPKKYFQTDCKICFCSDNNDSNQVLYCDSCNTSYHLACYGLSCIPKEDPYFCQRCAYVKKQNHLGVKAKNIFCQICSKNNFPMKKINDHFYHVTCLILFNFVEFRDNKMELQNSISHKKLLQIVIENQLNSEDCDYCRKAIYNPGNNNIGMKIKCSYDESCSHYYHPICAYLSGCKVIINKTPKETLDVQLVCNFHFPSRSEQVYLRRYMLNFNEASSKKQQQFQRDYEQELGRRKQLKASLANFKLKYPNRILCMTKFIKNTLRSKEQREDQRIQTQTQALLQRIKQNSSFL